MTFSKRAEWIESQELDPATECLLNIVAVVEQFAHHRIAENQPGLTVIVNWDLLLATVK